MQIATDISVIPLPKKADIAIEIKKTKTKMSNFIFISLNIYFIIFPPLDVSHCLLTLL